MSRPVVTPTGEITPEAECEYDLVGQIGKALHINSDIDHRPWSEIKLAAFHAEASLRAQLAAAREEIESLKAQVTLAKQSNGFTVLAEAKLASATKATESLCAWLLHRFGPHTPEGREASTALTTFRSLTNGAQSPPMDAPLLTSAQCYCDTGNERKACMVRCVNSWNTRGVPR